MHPPRKKARLSPSSTLPHQRADCPQSLFHHAVLNVSHSHNLQHCEKCFCLVCDLPVTQCIAWPVHCMAFYTHPEWRALRYMKSQVVPKHLVPPKIRSAQFVEDSCADVINVDLSCDDIIVPNKVKQESLVETANTSLPVTNTTSTPHTTPFTTQPQPSPQHVDNNTANAPQATQHSSSSPKSVQPQPHVTSAVATSVVPASRETLSNVNSAPDARQVAKSNTPNQTCHPSQACANDNVSGGHRPGHTSVNVPAAVEPQGMYQIQQRLPSSQSQVQPLPQTEAEPLTQPHAQPKAQLRSPSQSQVQSHPLSQTQTQTQALSQSESQSHPLASPFSTQPNSTMTPSMPSNSNAIGANIAGKDTGGTNCREESSPGTVSLPAASTPAKKSNASPVASVTDAIKSPNSGHNVGGLRPSVREGPVQSNVSNARPQGNVKQEQQIHITPRGMMEVNHAEAVRKTPTKAKFGADIGASAFVSPITPVSSTQQKKVTADRAVFAGASGKPRDPSINMPMSLSTRTDQPRRDQRLVVLEGRFIDPHKGSDLSEDQTTSKAPSSSADLPSSLESIEGSIARSSATSDASNLSRDDGSQRRAPNVQTVHRVLTASSDRESPCQHVEMVRRHWAVDKLLPSPYITRKQNTSAPARTGKPFPQRVRIGYIDMWRPYCSHMSARSIELPVGRHTKDVASISSKNSVRVPGLRPYESEVIAREMGLDLDQPALYQDVWRDRGGKQGWPDMTRFLERSSYAKEDGTPMCSHIPGAMLACIHANLIEVRFELSHYAGAENEEKAFAMEHIAFSTLSASVRQKLEREQCKWLQKCEERLNTGKKLDTSNCCLLRAWIYLAPESFSSNMVAAANYCQVDSAHAHLSPLDGGASLGHKLACNVSRHRWRTQKVDPPSMPLKAVLKLEKQWDNLELASLTKDRYTGQKLATLMSAVRCDETGFVAPVGETGSTKVYASVLEATTADGSSTWGSLCNSHDKKKDQSLLAQTEKLIEHLRVISSEDEANIANKASIGGVLSSPMFTVSNGYHSTAEQPANINLPLRRYQKESLAWMLDQEKKRSISDPFWIKIRGVDNNNKPVNVFYCPMTGTMSRFAPPRVVGGVLAEEMGLGKTIIAVSLITSTLKEARSVYSNPNECRKDLTLSHGTLIVCPVSLLKQWEKELRTNVSPPLKVLCWYGSYRTYDPAVLASHDVVLTTYGILSGGSHNALLHVHWFRVIIDESTYLKGGSGSCDSELMNLISSRRWAISGTPFGDNFRKKFMPTMRFIGVSPFAAGAHFQRLDETFSTALHDPELCRSLSVPHFAYLMRNIMVRHVKSQKLYGEPLVELPSASGRCVLIELDQNEKREYQKLENEVKLKAARFLRNQRAFGSHFVQLAQMARPLRIMADGVDPETLKAVTKKGTENAKSEQTLVVHRTRTVGAKVKQLLRDVRAYRIVDSTSKFVVFTEFNGVKVEIKRYLEGHGFGVMTLDGSMTATRRGTLIKQFAEDADAAVLVLSMAAGACGLTLTMANVVVLFEVGLKMAMELQAVNRIHRIGQTRPVKALTYVARGTIDERIVKLRKRRGQPGVVGENAEGSGEELSTLEVYRSMFAYEG